MTASINNSNNNFCYILFQQAIAYFGPSRCVHGTACAGAQRWSRDGCFLAFYGSPAQLLAL